MVDANISPLRFKFLRRKHEVTQKLLAKFISRNYRKCTERTISRWENGHSKIPLFAMKALKEAILKEDINQLLKQDIKNYDNL